MDRKPAIVAAILLWGVGCGVREGDIVTLNHESTTFYYDKEYFDERNSPGPHGEPDTSRYNILYKGSRVRIIEAMPNGYMVVIESAILSEYQGQGKRDQYQEAPSMKGKVGWIKSLSKR